MSRLTDKVRNFDGTASAKESLINEKYNYPSDYCSKVLTKLADYEDKQEQGLLIELPCKGGDKLYQIKNDELYELILIGLVYDEANKEWLLELAVQIGLEWHKIIRTKERIGTTIFLTRSEAEEALAKMGGSHEDTD